MKRRYRIALLVIVTVFIINSSSQVLAMGVDRRNDEERFKELCAEVKSMDIEEQVQKLMKEGLNKEDAEHYMRLNILVEGLEKEKIEVLLDNDIEDISDEEFLMNKRYYRDEILKGDKKALRKAMKALETLINGNDYAEKIISTFSNKAALEIIYPDGSKISYHSRRAESEEGLNEESPLERELVNKGEWLTKEIDTFKKKPSYKILNLGYEEAIMDEGVTYGYDNLGWREGEWSFQSELAFSKVYLYTEFQLSKDGKSEIKYARGGQSSYGIVNIANSTGGIISRDSSQGKELPAEARNEVIFTVSGAFGASFLILSLSVEPGMNWTQYMIFRLYDPEEVEGEYRAKYQWYAADYK